MYGKHFELQISTTAPKTAMTIEQKTLIMVSIHCGLFWCWVLLGVYVALGAVVLHNGGRVRSVRSFRGILIHSPAVL